jgi:hypothetical protein
MKTFWTRISSRERFAIAFVLGCAWEALIVNVILFIIRP